jgi:hypothetical protein
MDSEGALRLLLREGDQVNGKTLRAFTILSAVRGSAGQRRAWAADDGQPSLIYRASFTDGTEAIITVAVP